MKTITIAISTDEGDLFRNYKIDDNLEDVDFWGEEVVDMFKTIKESDKHNF